MIPGMILQVGLPSSISFLDFHGFFIANLASGDPSLTETTWQTKAVELLMPLQLLLQTRSVMSSESRLSPWVCYKGQLKKITPSMWGPLCLLVDRPHESYYYTYKLQDAISISETIVVIGTINRLSYRKRGTHIV